VLGEQLVLTLRGGERLARLGEVGLQLRVLRLQLGVARLQCRGRVCLRRPVGHSRRRRAVLLLELRLERRDGGELFLRVGLQLLDLASLCL